ncbi:hypothetical protein FACS189426_20890 [Bacteroidia bacterium]|nr:hypothetical protein FACS189426_20890 [Bacteroidia bacterium]
MEYYFLADDGSTPSLRVNDKKTAELLMWHEHHEISNNSFDLYFDENLPERFLLGDFYFLSGKRQVVSDKIKNEILKLNPIKINYLPVNIHINNNIIKNYFIINSYNRIACMDLEQSEYRESHHPDGGVLSIDKLVLNYSVLDKIPLEERLVFILDECETYTLYHEKIIEKLKKLNPNGMHAINIKEWDSDMMM